MTARKPHKCSACQLPIAPGERHHHHTGKFDGDLYSDKVCRRCDYDRVRVVEHELAEGCGWSEAWPSVHDLVDHLQESGLGQTRPEDVPASFRVGDSPQERAAV